MFRYFLIIVFFNFSFSVDLQSNKKDLLEKLYKQGAFKKGEFILKSGQSSSIYIDLRGIISCPDILLQLSECLWNLVENTRCEVLCGVPYAALPVATAISIRHQKPMIIKRKEAKAYGTKKLIEGFYKKGNHCLIIEDVITTGSSILETIQALEQEGLIITDIAVCIDREQSGVELLKAQGYCIHVLYSLSEILDFLAVKESVVQ